MKKFSIFLLIGAGVLVLANCDPSKKVAKTENPPPRHAFTYETNLQPLIVANCTPCHIPAKGGNKRPYDNYANVKSDIDEIIRRIELNPTDRGFMPFKHAKLSDSTINVFKQWRTDGLVEK
jgi:hypothetical protein